MPSMDHFKLNGVSHEASDYNSNSGIKTGIRPRCSLSLFIAYGVHHLSRANEQEDGRSCADSWAERSRSLVPGSGQDHASRSAADAFSYAGRGRGSSHSGTMGNLAL